MADTGIRIRVKELRHVPASDLEDHEQNWREHPESQATMFRGLLDSVGFAGAILAYHPDGDEKRLKIIDGHLRKDQAGAESVPVLVTDLTDEEARLVLTTYDPISALASANALKVDALLEEIQAPDERIEALLDEIRSRYGTVEDEESDNNYTRLVESPVYEITGEKPTVSELFDTTKTDELLAEIDAADLPEEIDGFLRHAAQRHTVFNFRNIAEFYAHADADVQALMENSALIIIDFGKAIEKGFVRLSKRLRDLAAEDDEVDDEG